MDSLENGTQAGSNQNEVDDNTIYPAPGAQGYYYITFLKKDGSPDCEKAQEAFDWCKSKEEWHGWFVDCKPFIVDENTIRWNERKWPDGLYIKHQPIPQTDKTIEEWLQAICDAVKPELLTGSFHCDYSESDFDSNWYHQFVFEDGTLKAKDTMTFNSNLSAISNYGVYYAISRDTYTLLQALFRNKKTGREELCGYVRIEIDEDEGNSCCKLSSWCDGDIDDDEPTLCDRDGFTITDGNEVFSFGHFYEEDFDPIDFLFNEVDIDDDDSPSDWEFLGFSSGPSFIDRNIPHAE